MKNSEGSSMPIKNIVIISIIFLFCTSIILSVMPKTKLLTLATRVNNKLINEQSNNIEENIEKDNVKENNNEVIENISINEIKVAEKTNVTYRDGERKTVNTEITPIVETPEQKYISIQDVKISRDMDLTVRTGLSKEDFKILLTNLKTDRSGFFEENSDIIYDLCEKYQINEIFFCGLIAGESGWNIASNHRRTHNYTSLMYNGKLKQFASVEEGLEQSAKLLHDNYLSEGGRFYSGKTLYGVQKRYCPNSSTWVNLIYGCMDQIV